MGFFGATQGLGGGGGGIKRPPSLKSVTHMKLGTIIPYLKKIQKVHKSRGTPPEFC